MNKSDNKCLGVLGYLFGHKYIKVVGLEYVYRSDNCFRCGKQAGT